MAKKLAALVAAFALCATALLGGAGAASAAPVQADPYVSCNAAEGVAFYQPGQTDTCTVYGFVTRALPLVSATLYPLEIWDNAMAKSAATGSPLSPFPAGIRVGTGVFNGRGTGTVRITIPKKIDSGLYEIVFTNLFDKTQNAYEVAYIGNFA